MPWLHGLKIKHEQQKKPNYLKNKPFEKGPIISGMRVKNFLEKYLILTTSSF